MPHLCLSCAQTVPNLCTSCAKILSHSENHVQPIELHSERKVRTAIMSVLMFTKSRNTVLRPFIFLSQPTTQRAGGVGLYIRNGIQFSVRHDLTSSTGESEMLWVKIESDLDSNMICGVVYRHPSSNLETFLNNFYSVIGKISQEGKLCLISGDFNINLLNYDKHPLTEDFINTLGSFFLEPHILKPTRITSHSSTLIDNIFFNSTEY